MSLVRTTGKSRQPPAALMDAMQDFVMEAVKAKVLIDTGGLSTSAGGFRMVVTGGKLVVTDGPFAETKELVGGYAIMELKSREEALDWTRRFLKLHQDYWPEWEGECEMREMFQAPLPPRIMGEAVGRPPLSRSSS